VNRNVLGETCRVLVKTLSQHSSWKFLVRVRGSLAEMLSRYLPNSCKTRNFVAHFNLQHYPNKVGTYLTSVALQSYIGVQDEASVLWKP
jgi:hypothetical protein